MLFDFLSKKEKIYCQLCGNEITGVGGFVAEKKIYCSKDNFLCLIKAANANPKLHFEYESKQEIYEDIKDGRIIHYGKLETSVNK